MIHVVGMRGLGDNIYQRPFVRQIHECFLETPYPEFYKDMDNVYPVKPQTELRTQLRHMSAYKGKWFRVPVAKVPVIKVGYGEEGISAGMMRCTGYLPGKMDMPTLAGPLLDKPYIIVRPVTVRSEWFNRARNPNPQYVYDAAVAAMDIGLTVVSIADVEEGKEWIEGKDPPAHIKYHHGELSTVQLMGAVQHATAVIGGIGWILPACIAYQTPAWIIAGGQGGFNHPGLITDRNYMDLSKIQFAIPDNMCLCKKKDHYCDKTIKNHADRVRTWLSNVVP